MPRRRRCSPPGSIHHVFNRGIARRTVFIDRVDYRCFLLCLALSVLRGEIRVLGYCLMRTHFHLVLESVDGRLGDAMQRVMNAYMRHYNRRYHRDGPLWRGRYASKGVNSLCYREAVLRYVHLNPVSARLVAHAAEYEHSSARDYLRARGRRWLDRTWVESELGGPAHRFREEFLRRFGVPREAGAAALVERYLARGGDDRELDALRDASPPAVREWIRRKAWLADGTSETRVVLDPQAILEAARHLGVKGMPAPGDGVSRPDARVIGLLRDQAGLSLRNVARELGCSVALVHRIHGEYRDRIHADVAFGDSVAALFRGALDRTFAHLA